jgi:hypothetical protein
MEKNMYKPKNEELIKALKRACLFIADKKGVCPAGWSWDCFNPMVDYRSCPKYGFDDCEIKTNETHDVPDEKRETAADCWVQHFIRMVLEIDTDPAEANDE